MIMGWYYLFNPKYSVSNVTVLWCNRHNIPFFRFKMCVPKSLEAFSENYVYVDYWYIKCDTTYSNFKGFSLISPELHRFGTYVYHFTLSKPTKFDSTSGTIMSTCLKYVKLGNEVWIGTSTFICDSFVTSQFPDKVVGHIGPYSQLDFC